MSYPRKLHILVVEDDQDAIEAYKISLARLAKSVPMVPPTYVRSFAEAKGQLESDQIFHAVILDLNLPIAPREVASEGVSLGEQLLEAFAARDHLPIPVMLVVSGRLNRAERLHDVGERLRRDFWHGRLINKGMEQEEQVEEGLRQVYPYIDVGIHVRDVGRARYPALSPREEDLLRRCILAQGVLGVDLRWWSAEDGPTLSQPNPHVGPTKVLMGHLCLDDGVGTSLPTFFKFEPSGNGPVVVRDAGILAQKLGHVKVLHAHQARERCLIVTQSVTGGGWPVPLHEYLSRSAAEYAGRIRGVIAQVVAQLTELGAREDDQVRIGEVMWKWLSEDAMERVWATYRHELGDDAKLPNPVELFRTVRAADAKIWAAKRRCTHGDLNATNVAIDTTDADAPRAYVFDASGVGPGFEHADLATLEVTTVLFNAGEVEDLMQAVPILYGGDFEPLCDDGALKSDLARNVLVAVQAIRRAIADDPALRTAYAFVVFNAALVQLSGLGLQPSPNKVRNPAYACRLAAFAAAWLQRIASHLALGTVRRDGTTDGGPSA